MCHAPESVKADTRKECLLSFAGYTGIDGYFFTGLVKDPGR